MTVEVTSSYTRAAGNGLTTVFNFPFKIFDATDLVVRDFLDSTGVPTTKTNVTDYTVAISSTGEGGTVTFVAAPASGHTIDIRRTVNLTQSEDIRNQGRFLPEIHEGVFDKLETQIQDTRRLLALAPRLPDSELPTIDWDSLLSLANRKGKYFGFFNATTGAPELYTSIGATTLSQSIIGQFLYPQTAAEISAGVTPTNYFYPDGHVYRYGTNSVPGTTDMTTAFQNAALASLNPYVPEGAFKITASINLRDNQHWTMRGARIAITGNTKVFVIAAGVDDWSIRGGWQVTGDNDSAGSLSGSGAALEITDSKHFYAEGLLAFCIKGYGVHILPGSSTSPRAEHGVISGVQCYGCTIGFAADAGTQPGAEYCTLGHSIFSRNGTGVAISAGNALLNSCHMVDNTTNMTIGAGSNHAHGIVSNCNINHPAGTYNINATSVTNGMSFEGCHIFEGAVWLNQCKGITFNGGVMAPTSIINDKGGSSGYNYVKNNYWQTGYSTRIDSNNSGQNELIVVGGVGPAIIDSITSVTMIDVAPVYANVRRAAGSNQTLTSGVAAALVCNTESSDRRNAYDNTTGTFTVPAEQAGTYRIRGHLMFSGTAMSATGSIVVLKINGTAVAVFLPEINSTTSLTVDVDTDQYLAAADTVTLEGTITGTTPVFGHATYESRVMIERVG